uniref:Globin domain-containing protein n=1 Tax=Neogobius melanostomus TaxID=47308 RepID=A0A8C6TBD1_9GOBI
MTTLSQKDKNTVRDFWTKIQGQTDIIGRDTYFAYWSSGGARHFDVRPNSPSVVKHGITILDFFSLSELHAFTLCVDPANLKLLAHCMMVVLASLFPDDFIPEVHMAVDKFMAALSLALSEKYR